MDALMLVVFGGTGDLAKRKLIPALLDLAEKKLLPTPFKVLGTGRTAHDDESYREKLLEDLREIFGDDSRPVRAFAAFRDSIHYHVQNVGDPASFPVMRAYVEEKHKEWNIGGDTVYYLATAPGLFPPIITGLGKEYPKQDADIWPRVVVEKPFGTDFDSAEALNTLVRTYFHEEQVFRIDHFMGKEPVQNLMVTRFSNSFLEPLWNRNYISHVEITSSESLGVEDRGAYYDRAGALRDMLQNHLLSLLAVTAMEPPISMEPWSLRIEMTKVLRALRPIKFDEVPRHVIRGQYMASTVRGKELPGYREETGVDPQSRTETFAAVKCFVDNWRWADVPFYIRTGKRLPTRVTEIVLNFRKPPLRLFENDAGELPPNQLVIRIQPDEGFVMQFNIKKPGTDYSTMAEGLEFHYANSYQQKLPEAYERLLFDAMNGDATLFTHTESTMLCWKFIQPILDVWRENKRDVVYGYPAGSWGPSVMDDFIAEASGWRYPCKNLTTSHSFCEL